MEQKSNKLAEINQTKHVYRCFKTNWNDRLGFFTLHEKALFYQMYTLHNIGLN